MRNVFCVSALCGCLFACGPAMRGDDDDVGSGSGGSGSYGEGEIRECRKMDIVFVVDNSGSMQEEQSNLATNFPGFASVLQHYQNGGLDFRVALTTTGRDIAYAIDLGGGITFPQNEQGDDGEFRNTCNNPSRWLMPSDPTLSQTLSCRANVGTTGPSLEMPLLMSKWALKERAADVNAGFLRDDALLAIVMITDEDDSSTTQNNFTLDATMMNMPIDWNPTDQVAFLDQLKGNRTRWASAVIAGDGNCSSNFGNAADAVRLKQFVTLANSGSTQAVFSSICNGDMTKSLTDAIDLFQAACGAIIL